MHDSTKNGLYVACKYSRESIIKVKQLCKMLKIECIDSTDLHTTICYSRKPPSENIDYSSWKPTGTPVAKMSRLEVFDGRDGSNILVVLLDSPFLEQQHHSYMQKYALSYDHPQYHPHITLHYDYHSTLPPKFPENLDLQLAISLLYTEPLQSNWNSTK